MDGSTRACPPGRADRPVAEYRAVAQPELRRPRGRAARLARRWRRSRWRRSRRSTASAASASRPSPLNTPTSSATSIQAAASGCRPRTMTTCEPVPAGGAAEPALHGRRTQDATPATAASGRNWNGRPGTLLVLDNVNLPACWPGPPRRLRAGRRPRSRPGDNAGGVAGRPGRHGRPLALDQVSPDDGRKFLQRYRDFGAMRRNGEAARWIVSALDGDALSLEVVASSCGSGMDGSRH